MTVRLHRLEISGRKLVTPDLARGEIVRLPEEAWKTSVEPIGRDVMLRDLDDALDDVISRTTAFDAAAIDSAAAPAIHAALRLTRREAADIGVWRWLAVVHRPDFVRHRWEFRAWSTMRDRFWRAGTRPDSNAIGRLWWIAELTHEGRSYALTERVLSSQTLANAIFVRQLSTYAPAVAAAADALTSAPGHVVEATLLRLHRHLSIVPLEALSDAELVGLMSRWTGESPR